MKISKEIQIINKQFNDMENIIATIHIVEHDNTIQFEYTIPKYLLDEYRSIFPEKAKNLKTFLREQAYVIIVEKIKEISYDLLDHHTFKDTHGDEVIFIKFNAKTNPYERNYDYGAGMGTSNTIYFQFFKGYKLTTKKRRFLSSDDEDYIKYSSEYKPSKFDTHFKNKGITPLHADFKHKKIEDEFIIIPYTEERYNYLCNLQTAFENVVNNLNSFLKDLNTEKIDTLVSNKKMLL